MSETPRDGGHSDPTAPVPYPSEYTAPLPEQPDAGDTPYTSATSPAGDLGEQPEVGGAYGTPGAYGAPNPSYGTPNPPYGTPAAPYGGAGTPYGTPPPAYYASAAPSTNTSALVLTIISAIGTLSCCLPLPALILGIIALTKQTTDPENSAKLAKYGWITFGVTVALAVLAFIAFFAWVIAVDSSTSYDY